ncbi:MAG TPA: 16S rRNA (guanine(527)-N(7))-methyltransferase RsmG [Thermoanaerobacterales bacterium]|nr:16S rRNA (guanine(527)-N(7))-methyltransferase RsmG [Thermoanaerobacterales bacterium]
MNSFKDILMTEAQKQHIKLTQEKIHQFDEFRTRLLKWNKKVNLTNITKPEDFAKKHIIDSLMLIKYTEINNGARIIDVGTGPGIPGLIIKIYRPDIKLSLVESIRKKTEFIKWIIQDMNISNVKVVNERAENIGHRIEHREKYDIAVARAVSALNTLLELCLPFVKIGGIFVAMKGSSPEQELDLSKKALEILGGKMKECKRYTLDEGSQRNLIIISKLKSCPDKYPRRPGVPGKNPL